MVEGGLWYSYDAEEIPVTEDMEEGALFYYMEPPM